MTLPVEAQHEFARTLAGVLQELHPEHDRIEVLLVEDERPRDPAAITARRKVDALATPHEPQPAIERGRAA